MKPITLEMTAFGSYAEKTAIRFDEFDHGLFLIAGETGAGKTMIFDAIAFALYGETSGSERNPLRMHCDLVSPAVNTVVKLVFMQNGREYTAERTLHFSKKRGTEDEYNDAKQDAVLIEPDHVTVKGQEKVTNRCTELVGMNVVQFRQIVMLAQGEFREFLKADSDKKNEILGKLFDNSAFKRYQELLNGAKSMFYEQRSEKQKKLKDLIDESFPEEGLLFHPENPELLDNIKKLVTDDELQLNELKIKKTRIQEELEKMNVARGAAEGDNNDLIELMGKRNTLGELMARKSEMEQLGKTVEAVSKVLHVVRPVIDARRRADNELKKATEEIRALEKELKKDEEHLIEAQKAQDGDAEAVKRVEELLNKIHSLREQLPIYQELQKKIDAYVKAEAAEKTAHISREESEKQQASLKDEQTVMDARIEELKDIDHQVEGCADQEKTVCSAQDLLTGKDGIIETVRAVNLDEEQMAVEIDRLSDLIKKASEAETAHHELYQRFISGQAGILADKLRGEIESCGEAACPVCGMVHKKGNDAHFAVKSDNTPEESEVSAAEQASKQAEEERKRQDSIVQEMRRTLDGRKNDLLRRADPLFPGCNWGQISDRDFLNKAEKDLKAQAKKAKSALKEAKKLQKERKELIKKQEENRKAMDVLASKIEEFKNEESAQHEVFTREMSAASVMKESLKYDSAETALNQIDVWTAEQKELQLLINQHIDAQKEAQDIVSATRGNLEGKKKRLPDLENAFTEAAMKAENVLSENGFEDEASAEAVLAPAGDADEESWLGEQTKALHDYDGDCRNIRARIEELELKTDGKTLTDLDALDMQITAKREEKSTADDEYNAADSRLKEHESILEKAKEYKEGLSSTDTAWKRLNELGTLAMGSIGEGGKLSFDRYVMGAVFREILEMANRRIDIMSGGQYELVHKKESSKKNVKAGLDIEVLVNGTGKSRPASNLSGGEGFYASLALALGLSDVVQMHSGEKKLDALFIDEGFGTLSPDVLEKALDVLNQLSAGDRLVGIISHVDKLDESIPQKIRVFCDEKGSHVRQELS